MITLQTISKKNFEEIVTLHVSPAQKGLVSSNIESIAEAYILTDCHPFGIYADGVPVGFLMYCLDDDDSEYWLYRLMVDEKYQRQGYAESAMRLLLEIVKQDTTHHKIYLGVDLNGKAAPELYKKLGFRFDGRTYGKEHIMVKEY